MLTIFYHFTGRHPCLFCTATKAQIQLPPEERLCHPRTLDQMKADLKSFRDSGGDLKKAKEFNNVIDEPIFSVPLDQVSLSEFATINNFTLLY